LKIVHRDLKHGIVKVILTSLDDLWTLYNIVQKNNIVYAHTTREVKGDDRGRPSSRRVPVILGLRVQKAYFDRELQRLRIHGIVCDAPEDLNVKGSHHTFSISVHESVMIMKDRWAKHEMERLDRAITEEKPIMIVALDFDEACIAIIRAFEIDIRAEINSNLPGKQGSEKREGAIVAYFQKLTRSMETVLNRSKYPIIIVGPGFAKDNFAYYVRKKNPELATMISAIHGVGSSGIAGVHEAIRSGILTKTLRRVRALYEIELVEKVLGKLGASSGDVSYGLLALEEDARDGAIDTLLILDQKLRELPDDERPRIEGLLQVVEEKGGRVVLISSQHEGGKKLSSLGGLAAILRYQKHLE
jgi:protein pelota